MSVRMKSQWQDPHLSLDTPLYHTRRWWAPPTQGSSEGFTSPLVVTSDLGGVLSVPDLLPVARAVTHATPTREVVVHWPLQKEHLRTHATMGWHSADSSVVLALPPTKLGEPLGGRGLTSSVHCASQNPDLIVTGSAKNQEF